MPRNGTTGVYTRTDGTRTGTTVWTQAKNAGVKIVSNGHDTHDQDIATALNDCLTQDNKIKPTATFLPNADGTLDLGSSSVTWNNQYLKGNLHLIDGAADGARFYNASNYVELRAPGTLAANRVFTLPNTLGSSGQYLQTDGAGGLGWSSAGTGDVVGPASAVSGNIASFNTTTGKLIQDGGVAVANVNFSTGNLTNNGLVIGQGTRQVSNIAVGTSGQILQSNGGSAPGFVDRLDGLVFISSVSLSGTTNITTSLTTAYDMFRLVLVDVTASSDNSSATIDFTRNNGSTWTTASCRGWAITGSGAFTSQFMDDIDQTATANMNHCIVDFSRLTRSTSQSMSGKYEYFNSNKFIVGGFNVDFGGGSGVNGLRIAGANINGGTAYLYGYRKQAN